MDKIEITNYLEDNFISLEMVKEVEEALVLKVIYNFDEAEISAAKSYDNEETTQKSCEEDDYKSYLKDIASDNMEDILEDILEEFDVEGSLACLGGENYNKFIIVLYDIGLEVEAQNIIDEFI